jgi:hypothetical protein
MSLSPNTHVRDPRAPKPVTFGVLQPAAKPLTQPRTPALLNSKSARATLEYENPDLTLPSVSSF